MLITTCMTSMQLFYSLQKHFIRVYILFETVIFTHVESSNLLLTFSTVFFFKYHILYTMEEHKPSKLGRTFPPTHDKSFLPICRWEQESLILEHYGQKFDICRNVDMLCSAMQFRSCLCSFRRFLSKIKKDYVMFYFII